MEQSEMKEIYSFVKLSVSCVYRPSRRFYNKLGLKKKLSTLKQRSINMNGTEMKNIKFSLLRLSDEESEDLYDAASLNDHDDADYASESLPSSSCSDKHALIKDDGPQVRERVPLKDPVIVQQELICGYDGLRFIIITSIIFALAITIGMIISIVTGTQQVEPHGAIATDVAVCSDIGADMLKKGGHAVDAAVAAAFCLGVVHGQNSGLGGGGFLLVGNPLTNQLSAFNYREAAPAAATPTMFAGNNQAAAKGGLAVAIPGELKGLEMAWKQYGKLSWSALIQPSIDLAENGFLVTAQLAADISETDFSEMSQSLRDLYENRTTNSTLQRPSLASLLKQVAIEGASALDNETIAQGIVDTITSSNGILTLADLQGYVAEDATPIDSTYELHRLFSVPAPSSGPEILSALHSLSSLNLSATDSDNDSLSYHRFIEISKFAAAMARQLGDPSQTPDVVNKTIAMLSNETADRLRDAVNTTATYEAQHYFEGGNVLQPLFVTQATALVVVVDNNNNLVSLTSSLNAPFGSGLMTPSGIILNSAMNSFNWEGKYNTGFEVPEANSIAAGRRPMSNMAPFLSWSSSNLCLSRYAIGGIDRSSVQSATPGMVLKFLTVNSSQTLEGAIAERDRVFPSLYENLVEVEDNLDPSIVEGLQELGHNVEVRLKGLGVINAASEEKDVLDAYSDTRILGAQASVY